jgi:hypothetical protein
VIAPVTGLFIVALTVCSSTTAKARNSTHVITMSQEAAKSVPIDRTQFKLSKNDQTRFWSKVDRDGPMPDQNFSHYADLGKCWQWTGCKFHFGHGSFWLNGKSVRASRVSFFLKNGPIPDDGSYHGLCVCHKCDNPSCVNPEHLFLGTIDDDHKDRNQKGRQSKGKKHAKSCKFSIRRGEENSKSKLTKDQVLTIRSMYSPRENSGLELGRQFGVSSTAIYNVVKRRVWKHV